MCLWSIRLCTLYRKEGHVLCLLESEMHAIYIATYPPFLLATQKVEIYYVGHALYMYCFTLQETGSKNQWYQCCQRYGWADLLYPEQSLFPSSKYDWYVLYQYIIKSWDKNFNMNFIRSEWPLSRSIWSYYIYGQSWDHFPLEKTISVVSLVRSSSPLIMEGG